MPKREENQTRLDYFSINGMKVLGTKIKRLVSKGYSMPSTTGLTIESFIEHGTNNMSWYTRTELASLPTSPVYSWEDDPIWGRVKVENFLQAAGTAIPEVADLRDTSRRVVSAKEEKVIGEVALVRIVTAAAATVTWEETEVDEETGRASTTTKLYTLAVSKPAGAGVAVVGAAALYTTVERVSHNIWLSVTKSATSLGIGEGNKETWKEMGAMYWPPVLMSFDASVEVFPDGNYDYPNNLKTLFSVNMREAYSGEVLVTVNRWWQTTAPNTTDFPELVGHDMVPLGIEIRGNRNTLIIPPCLHGAVSYSEEDYVDGYGPGSIVTWEFNATSVTEWPATVTKTKVVKTRGGYEITQRIYTRPDTTNGGLGSVSVT